jgi:hypothetical protein
MIRILSRFLMKGFGANAGTLRSVAMSGTEGRTSKGGFCPVNLRRR